eukprot:2760619-Ditylum_brightwellii.AAC.1
MWTPSTATTTYALCADPASWCDLDRVPWCVDGGRTGWSQGVQVALCALLEEMLKPSANGDGGALALK